MFNTTIGAIIMWGQLVSAIGGLVQNRQVMHDTQKNIYSDRHHKIQHTVEDAKRAGIHPLYALGNPGASSGGQSIPYPGAMSQLGRAIDGLRNKKAQQTLAQAQLESTNAQTELTKARADAVRSQMEASNQARKAQPGGNDLEAVTLTGPTGGKFTTSKSSKTQQVEDEYGDAVGPVYGGYRAAKDLGKNFGKNRQRRINMQNKYIAWKNHNRRRYRAGEITLKQMKASNARMRRALKARD